LDIAARSTILQIGQSLADDSKACLDGWCSHAMESSTGRLCHGTRVQMSQVRSVEETFESAIF
jgi:hypothetical protein